MTHQQQHSAAVGIQLSASLSALGSSSQQVRQNLTQPNSTQQTTLSLQQHWLSEHAVWVGAYQENFIEQLPERCARGNPVIYALLSLHFRKSKQS